MFCWFHTNVKTTAFSDGVIELFLRLTNDFYTRRKIHDYNNFGDLCTRDSNIFLQNYFYKNENNDLPQIKQVFFKICSFCCFSDLKSAKVSIITPKMRLSTIMITTKKNSKSYTTLAKNSGSYNKMVIIFANEPFLSTNFTTGCSQYVAYSSAISQTLV